MSTRDWDLITVGAGPAGLMCAITAASGAPIEPPRPGRSLVIERGEIGQFARYGKLRLTYRWHFAGSHLIQSLESEARVAGIRLHEQERVVGVDLSGERKLVETTKATYRARAVALCPGFFPHGDLVRCTDAVRPVFSPAALEARVLGERAGQRFAILGGGTSTVRFALDLARERPEAESIVVVEDDRVDLAPLAAAGIEAHHGRFEVLDARPDDVRLRLHAGGGEPAEVRARILLVDYNSYTTATKVTDFLADTPLLRRAGYLVVDAQGRTSVPGVVAAGNVTTPISGALTALSTGFVAGVTAHRWLHRDEGGREPDLFPWLPHEGLAGHPLEDGPPEGWR